MNWWSGPRWVHFLWHWCDMWGFNWLQVWKFSCLPRLKWMIAMMLFDTIGAEPFKWNQTAPNTLLYHPQAFAFSNALEGRLGQTQMLFDCVVGFEPPQSYKSWWPLQTSDRTFNTDWKGLIHYPTNSLEFATLWCIGINQIHLPRTTSNTWSNSLRYRLWWHQNWSMRHDPSWNSRIARVRQFVTRSRDINVEACIISHDELATQLSSVVSKACSCTCSSTVQRVSVGQKPRSWKCWASIDLSLYYCH